MSEGTRIEGGVGVITGGASGIGLATATALARAGMNLVLADIGEDDLVAAEDTVRAAGVQCETMRTDVSDIDQVTALADRAYDRFDRVDFLFNNAGVYVSGPIAEMTHADWRWTIDVDLWGPIHGVEAFLPRMIEQGGPSHIANTSSFAGMTANRDLGAYCVAKYGVVALSEVLAKEARDHDIGVSVLCPMRLATAIDSSARHRQDAYGGPLDEPEIDVDEEQMAGRTLDADAAADLVVDSIRTRELYLFTHEESRRFIQRRFERIDAAFDAAPGDGVGSG
ncbi:MAG: SDR family NAD(P)-dependent oxidoreductase [Actinomycetota bacterium]